MDFLLMRENIALFTRFYFQPSQAANDALDNGSISFAFGLAALTGVIWMFAGAGANVALPIGGGEGDSAFGFRHLLVSGFLLTSPRSFIGLMALFAGMIPVAIAIVAAWEGLGSAGVVLRREFVPVLVCGLLSWSAAYLPPGVVQLVLRSEGLVLIAHVVFLVLFALSLRTALGSSTMVAAAATFLGWLAAFLIVLLWPYVGGFSYILFSPWVLYILYRYYSPDVRSLGDSMSSRGNFRRQLEAATINPRDADAHYQLGLIYEQRRQFELAISSFQRAVSIRADEADAQLHLGRSLRAMSRPAEALAHLQSAIAADPRVSRYEGWRDLGAALLDLGRPQEALSALERYTNAREYDPEGLFYYGSALRAVGREDEAKTALEQAVAAVETAPKYRRGQLRRWANQAKGELKVLRR